MNNNRRTPDDDNEKYGYVKYMSMEIQYSTPELKHAFFNMLIIIQGKKRLWIELKVDFEGKAPSRFLKNDWSLREEKVIKIIDLGRKKDG